LRRASPRAQGICVSFAFAEATTDLMKRLRTVMVFLLPVACLAANSGVGIRIALVLGRDWAELGNFQTAAEFADEISVQQTVCRKQRINLLIKNTKN